jgi:hypothetical protein
MRQANRSKENQKNPCKESSHDRPDQKAPDKNPEAEVWRIYQPIEPRLRNVNRMLADS